MRRATCALVLLVLAGVAVETPEARSKLLLRPERFALLDPPVGGAPPRVTRRAAVTLAGGPLAALADGALIIDADSGRLIRTDSAGAVRASLAIARGAPQLAVDRGRELAYVVDRAGDRIHVVSLAGGELRRLRHMATAAEPYGVALTPDGQQLLVTAIADRRLTAYATAGGAEMWTAPLAAEPRGVAVSRDGDQVAVGFLTSGAIARARLQRDTAPRFERIPLPQTRARHRMMGQVDNGEQLHPAVAASAAQERPGESHARAAFAVAFIGNGIAVVPHQLSTPHQAEGRENAGSYGGGASPPVEHRLAFVSAEAGFPRVAAVRITQHLPRALAYDEVRDRLYVFGHGSDSVLALADASQASVQLAYERAVDGAGECGASGAAVADDGRVLVWCSLSRRLAAISGQTATDTAVSWSSELTRTSLSADQLAGRSLFRRGSDARLSMGGAMACESCHPEARTDGLSWRIEARTLQTPLLAGRVAGTHPFKWDGGDPTLDKSLANTVRRLGGSGVDRKQRRQLAAFLESLPRPRAAGVRNPGAVARGKALFASREVGCASCHAGARLTDRRKYPLATDMAESDTPSLIGLAASAPYFHDGSAATLEALLTDRGSVHGMGRTAELGNEDMADLLAYLATL